MANFQESQLPIPKGLIYQPATFEIEKWLPLQENFVKPNWNVVINSHNATIGLGGIFKDSRGKILAFLCNIQLVNNPTLAEAIALRKIMFICLDLGFNSLVFEGDYCKLLVSLIYSKVKACTKLSPILFDIQVLLHQNPLWPVTFMYRKPNMVTHSLAMLACQLHNDLIWIEDCPSNVMSYVLFDKFCNVTIS